MKNLILQELVPAWLQEAGRLTLRMREQAYTRTLKQDHTPVTAIDMAVESLLRDKIMNLFPAHGILGEEGEAYQPEAEYCWVIDPIDGTRALMAGFSSFTILLALAHKGQPFFGAVYQPVTQELWLGSVDVPTTLNGKILTTRPCLRIEDALFSTTSPYLFTTEQRVVVESLAHRCMAYQLGGDAYAYAQLASGNIDLIIESGLKPHDFMALSPVINGAGGIITDWQGQPITITSKGDICAAANSTLHAQAIALLKNL